MVFRLPDPCEKRKKGTKGQKCKRNPVVLAKEWKEAIEKGEYKSKADLARRKGISRARATQILNLLKLHLEVQEMIARLGDPVLTPVMTERTLRAMVGLPASEQRRRVEAVLGGRL